MSVLNRRLKKTPRERLISRIHGREHYLLAQTEPHALRAFTRILVAPSTFDCILGGIYVDKYRQPYFPIGIYTTWARSIMLWNWPLEADAPEPIVYSEWSAQQHCIVHITEFREDVQITQWCTGRFPLPGVPELRIHQHAVRVHH